MNEFDLRKFLYNNPLMEKKEDSKKGNKEEQKRMEGAIRDDRDHIKDLKGDIEDNEKKLARLKKDFKKDVNEVIKEGFKHWDQMNDQEKEKFIKSSAEMGIKVNPDGTLAEDARTDAEEEGYLDGEKDEKKKLTKESLKNMIREKITSILNEQEDVDVEEDEDVDVDVEKDVNVDVEDEVDVDDESVESDVEVKTEVPGEDADTAAVLGLLTKAQEEAEGMGDEVLMDQIGNTITYFTRKHVVKASS